MKRYFPLGSLLTVLALAVLFAAVPGCPDKAKKDAPAVTKTGDKDGKGGDAVEKKAKGDPLVVKNADAVVKGRVTYDGELPKPAKIEMKEHADAPSCHAPVDPTWIFGKDKGVEGVVVSLTPADGKFFALDAKQKDQYKGSAWIDQPLCLYEPHIVAIFAAYKTEDGKLHETGEKLLVKNSGKISHNTKVKGDERKNPLVDKDVGPGTTDGKPYDIAYQSEPIDISCSKHSWMNAKLIAFDHPFFAVTDKDGNFEIKNVPSGVEFTIKTWHEQSAPAMEKKTFSKGDNDVPTMKIKASS